MFRKAFEGQTSPYAAKVSLFDKRRIEIIIQSMLAKCYRAKIKTENDDEDREAEDASSDDYSEIRTVLDAFTALFADHEEFESDADAQKYLDSADPEDFSDILNELVAWVNDLVAQHLDGKDNITINAPTPDELLYLLQPYTYQLIGDECNGMVALWPIVEVVEFGLDHPLLNEGVVLVDAPGLSDSNSTRAINATIRHRQCTHKIIVADVSRAKNDKSLQDNLASSFRLRGPGGTMLVLTRGDSIDGDTEVSGSPAEKKQEQILRSDIRILREGRQKLNQERRKASREEQIEIDGKISETATEMRTKMEEYDTLRVTMRNNTVLKALKEKYKELTRDPHPLAAFVVGNESYKKHQAGYSIEERPTLSVKDTCIPALRKRIYTLPAEGKLNQAQHLAKTQIPSLVSFFSLYCAKTHFGRKKENEAHIMEPVARLPDVMDEIKEKLKETLKRRVLNPLRFHESSWVTEARKLCRKWAVTHRKDHLTVMKREGFKRGVLRLSKPDICWNADLLEAADTDKAMEEYFHNLLNELPALITEELQQKVGKLLVEARTKIKADKQFILMAPREFLDSFKHEVPNLTRLFDHVCREFRRDVASIQQDATKVDATSYLVKAMRPIYEEIHPIRGRDAPTRRLQRFEQKVARPSGVYLKIHDGIEKAFMVLIDRHIGNLEKGIKKSVFSITKKFHALCEDTETNDPEEKVEEEKLRKNLQSALVQARLLLDGPIQEALEACKNYNKEPSSLFVGENEK